jgi:hypothetical protein
MRDDEKAGVGFKKTPRHTRFRKGQSGNPKGRPKGRKNYRTRFLEIIDEKVTVNENGRRRKLPKFDVAVRQATNQAVTGDPRGMKMLLELYRQFVRDSDDEKQVFHITMDEDELKF